MRIKSNLTHDAIDIPVNTPNDIKCKFIKAVLALNEYYRYNILECDEDLEKQKKELSEVQKY